jgi:hypothetical protein
MFTAADLLPTDEVPHNAQFIEKFDTEFPICLVLHVMSDSASTTQPLCFSFNRNLFVQQSGCLHGLPPFLWTCSSGTSYNAEK